MTAKGVLFATLILLPGSARATISAQSSSFIASIVSTDTADTIVSRDLDSVLRAADVVSLHCPLIPQTHHLINADRLTTMERTAFLVNTARGAVVDETALISALRSQTIAGAALDSFEVEPPAGDNPLWTLPNVIATPHVGGASRSALRNMAVQSAQHIIGVLEGRGYDSGVLANRDLVAAA